MRTEINCTNRIITSTLLSILLIFALVSTVFAEDLDTLSKMNSQELAENIQVLEDMLKADAENVKIIKLLGIAYHTKAQDEGKKFALKAVETLAKGRNLDNKDMEMLCYLGSATTMMANTTWNPMKKMNFANTGIGYMDKAIRKAPDNITVRFTRGYNSMALPNFLKRKPIAIEDFEYLAALVEKNPGMLGPLDKEIYKNLAELYKDSGNKEKAEEYKKKAGSN